MDRRSFLQTIIGGVAAAAAVRSFPFRVFSFPSNIAIPEGLKIGDVLSIEDFHQKYIATAFAQLVEEADRRAFAKFGFIPGKIRIPAPRFDFSKSLPSSI